MSAKLMQKEMEKIMKSEKALVITPAPRMQNVANELIKKLTKEKKSCIYVALNKPFMTVEKVLKKEGVDTSNVYFIDCICSVAGVPDKVPKNVTLVRNPHDLANIGIAIHKWIKKIPGETVLIIDALRTLLIYNKPEDVETFVKSTISKVEKEDGTKIIMLSTVSGEDELVGKIQQYFDLVEHIISV